jgi:hypothetical protein
MVELDILMSTYLMRLSSMNMNVVTLSGLDFDLIRLCPLDDCKYTWILLPRRKKETGNLLKN